MMVTMMNKHNFCPVVSFLSIFRLLLLSRKSWGLIAAAGHA
jgi:hypothetical protein